MSERYPPPWAIKDIGDCFVVKASNDRPLVFIYYGEGSRRLQSALPNCPRYCGSLDLFD
jgi:hypothetical protein